MRPVYTQRGPGQHVPKATESLQVWWVKRFENSNHNFKPKFYNFKYLTLSSNTKFRIYKPIFDILHRKCHH